MTKTPPSALSIYRSRLVYAFVLLLVLSAMGTLGYRLLEGWAWLDALYMTVITMTTIGYGETHPLSVAGRIFTIVLIIGSVGMMGYAVSTLATFIIEGEFNQLLRGRKMLNRIAKLTNHIILCGAGLTGQSIVEEFQKTRTPFVLIEQNPDTIQRMLSLAGDIPYIQGNATLDETLLQAGIKRARGLMAVLGEDKDNVFIVLSARALNPNLRIVARLIEEENAPKLCKAGADEVVSPNAIGGLRMASVMLRPTVVSFLDQMLRASDQTLRVEEACLDELPQLIGKTLAETDLSKRLGLLVVAIKSERGHYQFNPSTSCYLQHGDVLIMIGTPDQLEALRAIQV